MMSDTQAEEKPRRRSGPKSTYTEARGRKVIEAVLEGKTNRGIAATPGLPALEALHRWLRDFPEFRERYAEAKFVQVVGRMDEVIDLADDQSIPVEDRKLMVDARKWLTGRLLPAVFTHPYIAPPMRTSAAELEKLIESKEQPAEEEAAPTIEPDDALDRELAAWRDKGKE